MYRTLYDDRIYGCIFGGAIGDALGSPVEFSTLEAIRGRFGPKGITELPDPALYTDDTQMTIRVAQGILDVYKGGEDDIAWEAFAESVASQFILWKNEDPPRAPGTSCLYGVANIERGVPPLEAGKPDSKGCGSVMRSAPYGILLPNHGEGDYMAGEHSRMTHLHPAAAASAAALATGIRTLVFRSTPGFDPDHVVDAMVASARVFDVGTSHMIQWARALAFDTRISSESVLHEWQGWVGDEAIAASVFCWIRSINSPGVNNYLQAIRLAVNSPGDSDSLGAITGNLAGASYGISKIPEKWRMRIENAEGLKRLSNDMISIVKGLFS